MEPVFIILGSVFVLYFLVMIPFQYSYISEMKDLKNKTTQTQNQLYEKMSFGEEQLHVNLQGNLFNLPSTLMAMFIYKIRHRHVK